jgi:hypothetical protein
MATFPLMEDRIRPHREAKSLLGKHSALEAQDILTAIDDRKNQYLFEACQKQGISVRTYSNWHERRGDIGRIAQLEYKSQFVRISDGIGKVRNERGRRFREILQLSLGLHDGHRSLDLETIAERHGVAPRVMRIRSFQADMVLLEKLGIIRPGDPVSIVQNTNRTRRRHKHLYRKAARPERQEDAEVVAHHIRALKQRKVMQKHMKTLERRWGLNSKRRETVKSIANQDSMSPSSVEWRERSAIFALHRRAFLANTEISEDVRIWAGLVFHVLASQSSENKRLLARTLDSEEPWKISASVQGLQQESRNLLYSLIGVRDGHAYTAEEMADFTGVSAASLTKNLVQCIEHIARDRKIPPFSVAWLNHLAEGILGHDPRKAENVLGPDELGALQSALGNIANNATWQPAIQALRLRSGLADGTIHPTSSIQEQTKIDKRKFAGKMRGLLRVVEQTLGR